MIPETDEKYEVDTPKPELNLSVISEKLGLKKITNEKQFSNRLSLCGIPEKNSIIPSSFALSNGTTEQDRLMINRYSIDPSSLQMSESPQLDAPSDRKGLQVYDHADNDEPKIELCLADSLMQVQEGDATHSKGATRQPQIYVPGSKSSNASSLCFDLLKIGSGTNSTKQSDARNETPGKTAPDTAKDRSEYQKTSGRNVNFEDVFDSDQLQTE